MDIWHELVSVHGFGGGRLVRYAARPPLSTERLEELPDGRLRYWFKTAWHNGTNHAIFEPLQFIERLAALIPTPRAHAADVLACTHCGGRLRILSTIRPPEITRKILEHLGLPSRPPPIAAAVLQEPPFAFE